MAIIYKTKARINNYDIYLKLGFMRIRDDISKLLKRIEEGDTLTDIFPNVIVSNSVRNFLRDNNLITETQKVSTKGNAFIKTPYFEEEEEGVFSIEVASLDLNGKEYSFIVKMTRKLDEDQRETIDFSLAASLTFGNTFNLEEEKCIVKFIENKSGKAYPGNSRIVDAEIDVTSGKYAIDNIKGELGNDVVDIMQTLAKEGIDKAFPEFTYSEKERCVFVNNVRDLSEEEIGSGQLNRELSEIKFRAEPFKIRLANVAIDYAYNYAYYLLDGGKFLSTNDLDDIFVNEILSGKNIHDQIKESLLSFKYSLDEFGSRLSRDKYNKLDYRIRITRELLDVDAVRGGDKSFATLSNYDEVTNYLSSKVAPFETKELYLVMGYAFVENKKNPNKIIDCLKSLLKTYSNITVVNKAPNQSNVSEDILDRVKRMGVNVVNRPAISDFFHDRYIIFKKNDGTYEVFMCSSEIGQLFGSDNHVRGSILKQRIQDVTMQGRNLIEITAGR